jgi:hypothetical protein
MATVQAFEAAVQSFLGVPYLFGGTTRAGIDCSGLIMEAAQKVGITIPRTTTAQWAALPHVPVEDVQPGDLVYFTGGDPPSPGHVGMVDKTGTTFSMIDAPFTGVDVRTDTFTVPGSGDMHVVGFARVPGLTGLGAQENIDSSGGAALSGGGGILSLPSQVTSFFDDATRFAQAAMWLVNPENWMRVIAGLAGAALAVAGVGFLIKAA